MFQTTDQQCMLCCLIRSIKHILYQDEYCRVLIQYECVFMHETCSANIFQFLGKDPSERRDTKTSPAKNQPMESDGYGHLVFDSKSLVINQLFLRGIQLISVVVVQNIHGRWSCQKVVNDLLACHGNLWNH